MDEDMQSDMIDVACDYAMQFAGMPYIWGGNNPLQGFDCSGFAQEILASMGLDPRGDQTAHNLYIHFLDKGQLLEKPQAGCLLFYGEPSRITHVAFCLNEMQMIESGGGGRECISDQMAAIRGAYVRVRALDARDDLVACILPFSKEG